MAAPSLPGSNQEDDSQECNDAYAYFMRVREAFVHQPRKLEEFMEVVLNFQSGMLDTVEVMTRVATLLRGHTVLLRQFNYFLPEAYRFEWLPLSLSEYKSCYPEDVMQVPEATAKMLATSFVERIEDRFAGHPEALLSFAEALEKAALEDPAQELGYREVPPSDTLKVHECVLPLLKHEPELLQEYLQYLPVSCYRSNGHTHIIT